MAWNRRRWCTTAGLGLAAGALPPGLLAAAKDLSDTPADTKGKADGRAEAERVRDRFGSPLRPFSAQSPWNCRPVDPVLDDWQIPKASYVPALESGKWSTGVFICGSDDGPMKIVGLPGQKGIWDPDAETTQPEIVLPRWPASVIPAEGSDGHADIVDAEAGIIHSLFKLLRVDDQWCAKQYAWTRLDGRGWGDPAHYFQGARAAAVPTMGGLVRRHEVEEGAGPIRHALAISLTFNGLSADPGYVFPATSADAGLSSNNGRIPEGALLMLPPDFDTAKVDDPRLRRIAEALKVYGGYVVDRNIGTPFVIYAEIGSNAKLHTPGVWNSRAASDLERMRLALRRVSSTRGFLDGHGRPVDLRAPMNLLSMRGAWRSERDDAQARFETWKQAVVLRDAKAGLAVVNTSGRHISAVNWARPQPGQTMRLTARTGNGATLRLQLSGAERGAPPAFDSGDLEDGKTVSFQWPEKFAGSRLVVRTTRSGDCWARGDLLADAG
ncbi:hypothetical protein [Roseateles chitosanitabidus]|uniref:hypothetical protein n=1 Tax=Roseateles chitosanitabidus TaxID=65048 RepID=UPI00082B52BC|nr:hypothetical protein [Roseateles chitosanitabidus]